MRKASFAVVFVACAGTLAAQEIPLPSYEVARAGAPLNVDGRLDEAAWAKATPIRFVRNLDGTSVKPETEARMLFDDVFLYFGFRAADENLWASMERRDDHLWKEEVVEVFIQADARHPSYIELEVNPLGTLIDIFLIDVRKPLRYESWNSAKIRWAAHVDGTVDGKPGDRGWSCEIAMPLEDVVTAPNIPPKPGDRWRVNLYRIERKPEELLLAWSPTLKNDFHMPARFGEIVFVDRP
jgi:hypothetical protein